MAELLVRYFGAARAATGVDEERLVPDRTLDAVLSELRHRSPAPGGPSLARVLERSSFLLNEVALRDGARVLVAGDVLDVLPPFAGG